MTDADPDNGDSPPNEIPAGIAVYHTEAESAHKHILEVISNYRKNTTTLLAIATGAATFFGFATSDKGILYILALSAYTVGATMALWIYWPIGLSTNMAYRALDRLRETALTEPQAKWYVVGSRLKSIQQAEVAITGLRGEQRTEYAASNGYEPSRFGISWRFRLLIVAVSLTTILAGANSVVAKPTAPAQPTHIIIDGGLP